VKDRLTRCGYRCSPFYSPLRSFFYATLHPHLVSPLSSRLVSFCLSRLISSHPASFCFNSYFLNIVLTPRHLSRAFLFSFIALLFSPLLSSSLLFSPCHSFSFSLSVFLFHSLSFPLFHSLSFPPFHPSFRDRSYADAVCSFFFAPSLCF